MCLSPFSSNILRGYSIKISEVGERKPWRGEGGFSVVKTTVKRLQNEKVCIEKPFLT